MARKMDIEQGMYDDTSVAEYSSPLAVGDEIEVHGRLSIVNDVGGTSEIEHAGTKVRVVSRRWDDETGWRFTGQLVDDEAIAAARSAGTSEYDADHYRRNYPDQPHLAESSEKAAASFDPSRVFFSEHDIEPKPRAAP